MRSLNLNLDIAGQRWAKDGESFTCAKNASTTTQRALLRFFGVPGENSVVKADTFPIVNAKSAFLWNGSMKFVAVCAPATLNPTP